MSISIPVKLFNMKSKEYTSEYIDDEINKIKTKIESGDNENAIKIAKDIFDKINQEEYNSQYERIWDISSAIINIPKGRKCTLEMMCKVEDSKKLSKEARLYITKKIKVLYILSENYAKSSEYIIKTIQLAIKNNNIYEEVKSKIELALIYRSIGGHETAINILEEALTISIKDKKDDAYMKVYAYINLAEIYIEIEKFDKAKEICNIIPKYEVYLLSEDYRDIEILKNIIESKVYINKDDLISANESLSDASLLITEDKDEYIADKEIEYLIAKAKYYYKIKDYSKSIDIYKNVLDLCEIKKKNSHIKVILYDLINLSTESNNHKLKDKCYEKIIKINKLQENKSHKDYSNYIVEHMNNEANIINNIKKTKIMYITILIFIAIGIILIPIIYKNLMKIKYELIHDGLTDALNRSSLDKNYKSMLDKDEDFAIIIFDIDNFKSINDLYGHVFGDIVLINICRVINNMLSKDTELYRYGGEEFVVLTKNKLKEEVLDIAESIRYYIERIKWKEEIKVTVSIGVAHSNNEKQFTMEKADENMYKAKNTGKNKVIS